MRSDTSKPLRAGDLEHVVSLIAPAGTVTVDESLIDSGLPAAITVLPLQFQGRESLGLGGQQTQTIYTVSVRYRTDVLPSMLVVETCCTQRRFQIIAIVPSDRRDALDMTCVTNG